jgi:hypothetical protein
VTDSETREKIGQGPRAGASMSLMKRPSSSDDKRAGRVEEVQRGP